jgi:hypothetical protein
MAFTGTFPAPVLQVAPCGLLSVADVVRDGDDHWIRGFDRLTNRHDIVRLVTVGNIVPTDGTIYDGSAEERYYNVIPFVVEAESQRTAGDLREDNPLNGSLKAQLDAATQKVAERELWEGTAALDAPTPGTGFLRSTGGATILTAGGVTSARALALLEQSISDSPTGSRGVIHMTRDVASDLGSRLLYKANSQLDDNAYVVTRLGTLVVIGSGYTGNGPIGTTGAAATATNKWMFATGGVDLLLGQTETVNDSISQGFNPATNDSIVKVQRPAAVSFDPSIWSTAQVTLS